MLRQDRSRKLWAIIASVVVALMISGATVAQGPYPHPPPVFPVLDEPHDDLLSPIGGQTDRPMLVVYVEFRDQTFDRSNPPPGDRWVDTLYMSAGDISERFFSDEFPSVADYFNNVSNGHLQLFPADNTDSSNGGAVNDGVVSITIDENKNEWVFGDDPAPWPVQQRTILEVASEHVDFSSFDSNSDGRVTEDELIIVRHDVDPQNIPDGSGAIQRAPAGLEIDDVILGKSGEGFKVANTGTATNLMTIVHEIGHAAFDMPDTYFHDVGNRMDLGGGTSNVPNHLLFRANAWHYMHLGWAEPTVVTESGFYDVPREPWGTSFILYDPEKGTDDYFIVENRSAIADTYDQGVGGTGLVVWRIDESVYHPADHTDFMTLIAPDGPGQAWSPTFDPGHAHRTMENVPWRDGTPSNIAIRAISPADDVMRVYFDVRGPGLLFEPATDAVGNTFVHDVTPGESNSPFSVPATNTGEEGETFSFYFDNLPGGWSSEPHDLELEAGERGHAQPSLVPDSEAPTGVHEVTLVGESADVREEVTLQVNVVLEPTSISYTGETYVPAGELAGFAALVTMQADDSPVTGAVVTFELSGPGGELSSTGTTGADGRATSDPVIDLPPGDYQLRFAMDRFGKHAPAEGSTAFRVPTVAERLEDLMDGIVNEALNPGIENSLLSQLQGALDHVNAERGVPACNALEAFGNHVEAQSGKQIPDTTADAFLEDVHGISNQFGCES